MENSTIKAPLSPTGTSPKGEEEIDSLTNTQKVSTKEQLKSAGKKAKILFDIVILLIAFTGVIISCMGVDTESILSLLQFIFPMIMYVWAILNRILDIYKQVN